MTFRAALLPLVLAALLPARPVTAAPEAAAYERAFFRTFTLLYNSAPQPTIAAATQCAATATADFPDDFKQKVIEIDRRPVYRGDARFEELIEALLPFYGPRTKPIETCFSRLGAGEFGETQGAILATAAPNPDAIAACPISLDRVSEGLLTCYCQPMLGGVAYGHKTYADTSSICLAARHAGAMDYLTGGVVSALIEPGCASYAGAEANGYPSGTAGRTERSFHFPVVGQGACPE